MVEAGLRLATKTVAGYRMTWAIALATADVSRGSAPGECFRRKALTGADQTRALGSATTGLDGA
jgi:hypothetical protein